MKQFMEISVHFFGLSIVLYLMQILEINPKKKDIYTLVAADFELTGYDPHK